MQGLLFHALFRVCIAVPAGVFWINKHGQLVSDSHGGSDSVGYIRKCLHCNTVLDHDDGTPIKFSDDPAHEACEHKEFTVIGTVNRAAFMRADRRRVLAPLGECPFVLSGGSCLIGSAGLTLRVAAPYLCCLMDVYVHMCCHGNRTLLCFAMHVLYSVAFPFLLR